MKIALLILLAIAGLAVLIDIGLRLVFGFGNPLVYIADDQIGYLLAPGQDVRRFGNRIVINQQSMRSSDVAPVRSPNTLRVFLLGDSVANGGWWTDQTNTISEIVQRQLQALSSANSFQQVEVLNASANSWGPRNELAYLKRFGTFEAQVIVLLINTDDLFATAPSAVQVGRDRNYPDRKPPFALVEVVGRYVLPQPRIPELEALHAEGGDRVGINLSAIQQIKTLVNQANGQFILGMTPLLREIGTPGPRDYEIKARQRLKDFTEAEQILYLDFLPIFNAAPDPKVLYHDHIHLSLEGNQQVSDRVTDAVKQLIRKF